MVTKTKTLYNNWQPFNDGVEISRILTRDDSVEGLDFNRYRSKSSGGTLSFSAAEGHIISLMKGNASFHLYDSNERLAFQGPTHLYIPVGTKTTDGGSNLVLDGACEIIHAAGPEKQAIGKEFIVRNEVYARAARYILTEQYLSRRIFVHRDKTLVSKNNEPVSWFHTTLFETNGLPENFEGDGVFKMGYDNQTELVICYESKGNPQIRYAIHPYVSASLQKWTEWDKISKETTYCINETADGNNVEYYIDGKSQEKKMRRNWHEFIVSPEGFVSMICVFDPSPTGLEEHTPGAYTSYHPVTTNTDEYEEFLQKVAPMDDMMNVLSMMDAQGSIDEAKETSQWNVYQVALDAKVKSDQALLKKMRKCGKERRCTIIKSWMVNN